MEDNLNSRISKGGKNKPEGDRRAEVMQAAKNLEKMSGIPMNKGENPVTYNLRVLKEYEPKTQGRDVATVSRRAGMLTAGAQPFIGAPAAAEEERG
jgi:adenosylcobinamide amidohydrolase